MTSRQIWEFSCFVKQVHMLYNLNYTINLFACSLQSPKHMPTWVCLVNVQSKIREQSFPISRRSSPHFLPSFPPLLISLSDHQSHSGFHHTCLFFKNLPSWQKNRETPLTIHYYSQILEGNFYEKKVELWQSKIEYHNFLPTPNFFQKFTFI